MDSSPVTFGDLADRVNAAWADVRTYRAEFRSTSPATPPLATPVGTNVATPIGPGSAQQTTPVTTSAFVALREVVLPD
ncbi:MAG TPA: hypothetical protein VER37_10005, partial [Thermomicrobiales bacterium]|nr:hypothetical protein [Thermomicrobiales bacterium]